MDISPRKLFLHVVDKEENDGHDFVRGHEVVSVEGVDDALFGMAEGAVDGNTAQDEETQVVRVECGLAINHLTCFVAVIESLPHGVEVLGEGLAKALAEHELVHH
jgi:hypothetical protein